jgi:ribosomal protein S18 acetylase RimI-like enzyme
MLEERHAFATVLGEEHLDYLVGRGEAADPVAARAGVRAEIEAEMGAGDEFWAAQDVGGGTVGWLWVKGSVEGLPLSAAFLYQILVKKELRRRGYGMAMLAALEEVLAASGRTELRLNVWDSNEGARRLYERAGYEEVERFPGKWQLRKRLASAARMPVEGQHPGTR